MHVEWDRSLEIGIKHIDMQHENLFGLLNILYEAIDDRTADKILKDAVSELLEYTCIHFTAEMNYMDIKAYPGRYTHGEAHRGFQRKIRAFADRIMEGELGFAPELANYIKVWLCEHITTEDIKLKEL